MIFLSKRRVIVLVGWFAAAAWLLSVFPLTADAAVVRALSDELRERLEAQRAGVPLDIAGAPLRESAELQDLYAQRLYRPAWFVDGELVGHARAVAGLLASARDEGLRPVDYRVDTLARMLDDGSATTAERADLELALTDAVVTYATDMLLGRVRPESLFPEWESALRDLDPSSQVRAILATASPVDALRDLAPGHRNYQRLRELLHRFREIERGGGWVAVPPGTALKPGVESDSVAILRHRLIQGGNRREAADAPNPRLFDAGLEAAVTHYQMRHGLEPDGIAGAATIESLNTSVSSRIRTIELNMERWRWLPNDLGPRFITVNIAGFELTLVDHGEAQLTTPVVVGKPYHATPVFSGQMTYVVFSPYWNVPASIATNEILPKLRQDPGYLEKESMKVFRGWGTDTPLDPGNVDWNRVEAANFPYRFRQEPGPGNSLGLVKFMFPNKYNVYLHDTPSKELFSRAARDFSHGCIRVKEPLRLAQYLLQDQWGLERIAEAARRGTEQSVPLSRPWPVHLLYWTAWVGARGEVNFRADVYKRDERLAEALYH